MLNKKIKLRFGNVKKRFFAYVMLKIVFSLDKAVGMNQRTHLNMILSFE